MINWIKCYLWPHDEYYAGSADYETLTRGVAEIKRLRAALKRIRQTHQRLEEDANEDMLDDTILEMDEIAREALNEQ
jgi:hypothetical protein